MINNYVKHGYVEKPDKKKYQRRQVARLIAITTLKRSFYSGDRFYLKFLAGTRRVQIFSIIALSLISMSKRADRSIIRSACQTVQLYLETLSYIQPVKTEEETDELHHETK